MTARFACCPAKVGLLVLLQPTATDMPPVADNPSEKEESDRRTEASLFVVG